MKTGVIYIEGYKIRDYQSGKSYWISNDYNEGMEVPAVQLRELLDKFWKDKF
jgi:hypothetical protein